MSLELTDQKSYPKVTMVIKQNHKNDNRGSTWKSENIRRENFPYDKRPICGACRLGPDLL